MPLRATTALTGVLAMMLAMLVATDRVNALRWWVLIAAVTTGAASVLTYLLAVRARSAMFASIASLAQTIEHALAPGEYSRRVEHGTVAELRPLTEAVNRLLGAFESRLEERTGALRTEVERLRTTHHQLAATAASAADTTRTQEAMLATISQGLRTPLDVVIGYTQLAMTEASRRQDHDAVPRLRTLTAAVEHLRAWIDSVAAPSTGGVRPPATFQPGRLLTDVATTIQPLANERGNRLVVELARGLGDMAGDAGHLRHIVSNLLLNAAKFTAGGTITLSARRIRSDRQGHCDWLEIVVADTGVGMSPEVAERLREEFSSADAPVTRRGQGAGLGLAVSRRFCHAMGGRMTVSSRAGAGSTLTVTLPAFGGLRIVKSSGAPTDDARTAQGPEGPDRLE